MKYFLIIFISLLNFTNCLIAQDLRRLEEMNNNVQRSRQIKEYFLNKSSVDYLHNGFFYNSREKLLGELKISDFGKDTLVFVEIYSRESSGYICTIYKSEDINCISIYIERNPKLNIEYIPSDNSLMQYIVDEIKEGNIESILEKGEKSDIYPIYYIIITIATRQGKDYDIKSYSTKYFRQ